MLEGGFKGKCTKINPWEVVSKGLPEADGSAVFQLAAHESEPGVFYAVNNVGLFISRDAGSSWEQVELDWPDNIKENRIRKNNQIR